MARTPPYANMASTPPPPVIAKKERELSKIHLQSFIACSDQLANDYEEFKAAGKLKSETFEY